LTCAGDLRKLGYEVTIFEALHTPGGVLVYGIPEFRLPKQLVRDEIKTLQDIGVKIETNMVIGRTITLDELFEEEHYDAVFVGSGAGLPRFQKIPGENLNGVYSANEFLTRINLMKAYTFPERTRRPGGQKRGGHRRRKRRDGRGPQRKTARRGKRDHRIPPQRGRNARANRRGASRQGGGHHLQNADDPTELLGDENGYVNGMTCVEMELGEPDASGRRRPVVRPGSEHHMDVETVVVAIGNSPNPLIKNTTPGLDTQKWGGIIVDEATGKTSRPHVYAGGDTVTGAATVILAMGAGKTAAKAIHEEQSK
jgi:glutamate synthase (NADPH/NADH) small chain